MAESTKKTKKLETADRLLQLLECFSLETPEWGVTELSQAMGLYKSVVHRMLVTLENRGYIVQHPVTKKYTLGMKIFELGMVVANRMDLRKIARPFMEELSKSTNETVMLLVADGLEGICLEKVESSLSIKATSPLGKRVPLYAGATAKTLMAHFPEEKQRQIIANGISRLADSTIMDEEALIANLRSIREQGYCISTSEFTQGSMGISAPVTNYEGEVVASLSVTGPEFRMAPHAAVFLQHVQYAAALISKHLGTK